MLTRLSIASALVVSALTGCNEGPNPINEQAIQVVVRDQQSRPVEGAIVQGGFDWDFFQVRTDARGIALLPARAEGERASIYKTNFLPNVVPRLYTGIYPLRSSPRTLSPLGRVAGTVVRFGAHEVIAVDYQGTYRVYSYSDRSVNLAVERPLGDSVIAIKSMRAFGDTLWCATHRNGIFVYSLRDPAVPRFLFQLRIPGLLWPFVVKDSLVIVGDPWQPGPVRICTYRPDGTVVEISRVESYLVRRMELIGDALVLLGNSETLPVVLDIADPYHPRVVYRGAEPGYVQGFFASPFVVLSPGSARGEGMYPVVFRTLRVSAKADVTPAGDFSADAWLVGIAPGGIAYGRNAFDVNTTSLLEGSVSTGFTTVATLAEDLYEDIGGASPPYYVIRGTLWRLEDR